MRHFSVFKLLCTIGIFACAFFVMYQENRKDEPVKNKDNASAFVRYGETWEDPIGVKTIPKNVDSGSSFSHIDVPINMDKLINVDVQPEIPKEATITFGEQRTELQQQWLKWYSREMYVTAPIPYVFYGFKLSGTMSLANDPMLFQKTKHEGFLMTIQTSINNAEPVLVDNRFTTFSYLGNIGSATDIVTLGPKNHPLTSNPTKITISILFTCYPRYGKFVYYIDLKDIVISSGKPENKILVPDKPDFFIVHCNE